MIRSRSTPRLIPALAVMAILLPACSNDSGVEASTGNETAISTPDQGSPTQPEAGPGGWTPIPESVEEFLPAGRLGMTANGRPDAPWAVLEVPERFSTIGGWVIFDEDPKGGGGVGYWTVSEVVRDPCSDFGAANAIDAGSTVEEAVAAFQRQRLTRLTAPVPVSVDGYDGLSLELHVPTDIDFAECPEYNVWESDPAGARYMEGPGEFDKLWILNVDGDVVVLTVTAEADDPTSALDRLADIVESAEFIAQD
jgi:hypothetical protein